MSAPSFLHEERVAQLDTLALLARCRGAASLGPRTLPDVVRVDHETRRLFIGDGKATETPQCSETQRRLRRYAAAAMPWARAGYAVRLAVCHTPGPGTWRRQLETLASRAGAHVLAGGETSLDEGTAVSWVDIGASTR
jgi:hypothetical protein